MNDRAAPIEPLPHLERISQYAWQHHGNFLRVVVFEYLGGGEGRGAIKAE